MSKILNNGIFSETTIKIIAMISMLIDHIALCIPVYMDASGCIPDYEKYRKDCISYILFLYY